MKTLFLIRHAKSSWKDLTLNDFERPLNKRGKRDAPYMGEVLRENGEKPNHIVSSPATRAISTTTILAEEIGFPLDQIHQNRQIYEASFQELLGLIYQLDNQYDKVFMVGHNPGLTVLSDYLTDYYIDNIPTCGIVKITFETENWKEIIKGSGSMEYFKYPKETDLS